MRPCRPLWAVCARKTRSFLYNLKICFSICIKFLSPLSATSPRAWQVLDQVGQTSTPLLIYGGEASFVRSGVQLLSWKMQARKD